MLQASPQVKKGVGGAWRPAHKPEEVHQVCNTLKTNDAESAESDVMQMPRRSIDHTPLPNRLDLNGVDSCCGDLDLESGTVVLGQ